MPREWTFLSMFNSSTRALQVHAAPNVSNVCAATLHCQELGTQTAPMSAGGQRWDSLVVGSGCVSRPRPAPKVLHAPIHVYLCLIGPLLESCANVAWFLGLLGWGQRRNTMGLVHSSDGTSYSLLCLAQHCLASRHAY